MAGVMLEGTNAFPKLTSGGLPLPPGGECCCTDDNNHPHPPPRKWKWTCVDGECVRAANGQFATLADCDCYEAPPEPPVDPPDDDYIVSVYTCPHCDRTQMWHSEVLANPGIYHTTRVACRAVCPIRFVCHEIPSLFVSGNTCMPVEADDAGYATGAPTYADCESLCPSFADYPFACASSGLLAGNCVPYQVAPLDPPQDLMDCLIDCEGWEIGDTGKWVCNTLTGKCDYDADADVGYDRRGDCKVACEEEPCVSGSIYYAKREHTASKPMPWDEPATAAITVSRDCSIKFSGVADDHVFIAVNGAYTGPYPNGEASAANPFNVTLNFSAGDTFQVIVRSNCTGEIYATGTYQELYCE